MDFEVDSVFLLLLGTTNTGLGEDLLSLMLLEQFVQEGEVGSFGEHTFFLKHGEHTHGL